MVQISRRQELLRKLAAMPDRVRGEVKTAIHQGADDVTAMQKRLAPKKTGALANSIQANFGGFVPAFAGLRSGGSGEAGDPDLTAVITAGNYQVFYAHLVEFGAAPHIAGGKFAGAKHPGASAQPFFYPGYRATRRRVKARISRAITKAVRKGAS